MQTNEVTATKKIRTLLIASLMLFAIAGLFLLFSKVGLSYLSNGASAVRPLSPLEVATLLSGMFLAVIADAVLAAGRHTEHATAASVVAIALLVVSLLMHVAICAWSVPQLVYEEPFLFAMVLALAGIIVSLCVAGYTCSREAGSARSESCDKNPESQAGIEKLEREIRDLQSEVQRLRMEINEPKKEPARGEGCNE